MTKEDKQLLIKDLCARLPYGPKALAEDKIVTIRSININPQNDETVHVECYYHYRYFYKSLEEIKPYLFNLSSMTEEITEKLWNEHGWIIDSYAELVTQDYTPNSVILDYFDWLNAYHFDYRGLIDKGLAIDATNLNIY